MGLQGMIDHMLSLAPTSTSPAHGQAKTPQALLAAAEAGRQGRLARPSPLAELEVAQVAPWPVSAGLAQRRDAPVIGITGTGGAGKSSPHR
jgi:putative protein kinase ArgK-like GTPase of G3E family